MALGLFGHLRLAGPPPGAGQQPPARGLVALAALPKVEVIDSKSVNFDEVPLKKEGPTILTNFVLMRIAEQSVNASWGRTSEHGDVDSWFQIASEGAVARYSHRIASGEGWEVQSMRFEVKPVGKNMGLVAYIVDNPHGIPTNDQAIPKGQVSNAFGPVFGGSVSAEDLVEAVASKVGSKDSIEHWDGFLGFWKKYA